MTCTSTPAARQCPSAAASPARPASPDRAVRHRDPPHRAPRPRLLAPLQHPPRRPRYLTRSKGREVTSCDHGHLITHTLSRSAVTNRKTATVIPAPLRNIALK